METPDVKDLRKSERPLTHYQRLVMRYTALLQRVRDALLTYSSRNLLTPALTLLCSILTNWTNLLRV